MVIYASSIQRLIFMALVAIGAMAIMGGLEESGMGGFATTSATVATLAISLVLAVRTLRMSIRLDKMFITYRGMLRTVKILLPLVIDLKLVAYDGFLTKRSPSRQICMIRVETALGQRNFYSVLGIFASGRLRKACSQMRYEVSSQQ